MTAYFSANRGSASGGLASSDAQYGQTHDGFDPNEDPQEALRRLHEQYSNRLLGYAVSLLRVREDAEDVVQLVYLNAYNAIVDGRVPRQELPWLFRITRNACLNKIRSQQRRPTDPLDGVDVASNETVERQLDQRLHVSALRSALERLPDQQRTAIVMRELQGASYVEIAEAMRTTTGAVESLIFRARRQLTNTIRAAGASRGFATDAAGWAAAA